MSIHSFLLRTLLFPVFICLADTTFEGSGKEQRTADDWTRMMNKHMPLTGEILLLGVRGSFQQIDLLGVYDRDDQKLTHEQYQQLNQIILETHFADRAPYHHHMVCSVLMTTLGHPLYPRAGDVSVLRVSSQDGQIEMEKILKDCDFAGLPEGNPDYISQYRSLHRYSDYDGIWVVRVLGHQWPD